MSDAVAGSEVTPGLHAVAKHLETLQTSHRAASTSRPLRNHPELSRPPLEHVAFGGLWRQEGSRGLKKWLFR